MQALADHRERTSLGQLGSAYPLPYQETAPGESISQTPGGLGSRTPNGANSSTLGDLHRQIHTRNDPDPQLKASTGGVIGVMGLPYKVTPRKGPELEPSRFFRLLLATDAKGRVAIDHDVPGEIVGPPGSPLPLWDWIWSHRARARFPLAPPDQVPSPRRLLTRWCASGSEIRWVGWRYYEWTTVAAELGMTAVNWRLRWTAKDGSEDPDTSVADRARTLAIALKHWFRRYRGVSTRWLRGYLALFAELHEGGETTVAVPLPWSLGNRGPTTVTACLRASRQRAASLAWRLVEISVLANEGPTAQDRRCWVT